MVTADSSSGYRMFGLSYGDSNQNYSDIDFAMELQDGGGIRIYEAGTLVADQPSTYKTGDVLKVKVEYDRDLGHNVIRWLKNSTELYYDGSATITYPLLLDTSIYTPGAVIYHAYICGDDVGTPGS